MAGVCGGCVGNSGASACAEMDCASTDCRLGISWVAVGGVLVWVLVYSRIVLCKTGSTVFAEDCFAG